MEIKSLLKPGYLKRGVCVTIHGSCRLAMHPIHPGVTFVERVAITYERFLAVGQILNWKINVMKNNFIPVSHNNS